MDNLSYCYNKGCGRRFEPSVNSPDSCVYHPGVPVFHDVYKSWSCCKKKTTDFTEFLGIKGCTTSCHNGEKPPEEAKPKLDQCDAIFGNEIQHFSVQQKIKTLTVLERPDKKALPTLDLPFTIAPSLKCQLENVGKMRTAEEKTDNITLIGTSCKNGGCRKSYHSELDHAEECLYHPGLPVFHEGMKFWSCCVRRTSDFDTFLDQSGCTTGKHLWIKEKSPEDDEKISCRYDWYQTGGDIFVSVYAKLPVPSLSTVKANQILLQVHLVFGAEKQTFRLDLDLFGVIEVSKSHVTYSPNKVEIKLKKGEPSTWNALSAKY